jgi:glycosyltransferase involved in cell wall biosynthesis
LRITVITVAWNAAATIGDTLRSVAAQDHGDVEHLVIDGGSTDATAAVFAANAGAGASLFSEPDDGLYDAMNRGIARSSGDLIGFLNADDLFCRTDALSLLAAAARGSVADAVAGGVAIVDPIDPTRLRRAYPAHAAPWMLRFGHMPPHPGFYARRAAVTRVGGFDLTAGTAADFDWMVRFFLVHHLTALRIAPTLVTMRAGGVSNAGLASFARANEHGSAALRRHGRVSATPLLWTKYALKAWQLVARPREWPAPAAVRWPADPNHQPGATR